MDRVGLLEAMGIRPLALRARQALVALRGEEDVPPSRFDRSSLGQLRPRISVPLWLGRAPVRRRAIITNLFNHTQTPIADGWSVRRRQMRDFRGGTLTYDSHNGTDFCIPVGTPVLAPAPGEVVRVVSEFNRGGLKVFVDHGRGLMTCTAHLARALVSVGDRVGRGDRLALSGYSGLDGAATFPWGTPHIHLNTWLNGEPVDPFAYDGLPSLWRGGALPVPISGTDSEGFEPSVYDPDRVAEAIASCITPRSRERLAAVPTLALRAAEVIAEMNYYPTRFPAHVGVYAEVHPREPRLGLPFSFEHFDGVVFADAL
jgi:hypothetical protein